MTTHNDRQRSRDTRPALRGRTGRRWCGIGTAHTPLPATVTTYVQPGRSLAASQDLLRSRAGLPQRPLSPEAFGGMRGAAGL
jgi:hypothetical protein